MRAPCIFATAALMILVGSSNAVVDSRAAAQDSPQQSKPAPARHDKDAGAASITIHQGTVGGVGGSSIGVISVNGAPASGAPADKSADLALDVYPRGIPAEFTMQVRKGDLIPAANGMYRMEDILPESDSARAHVVISTSPVGAAASHHIMVYLTRDGHLRLNGPETHGASDMAITSWDTDGAAPSADVEWRPSQFAREDTDPSTIRRSHLTVGSHVTIGRVSLKVSAIEKATDHPAWIRFEIKRGH